MISEPNFISHDNENRIDYIFTPWNDATVGGTTIEIVSIKYTNLFNLNELFKSFRTKIRRSETRLVMLRIPSVQIELRQFLQENSYFFIDHSLLVQFRLKSFNDSLWQSLLSTPLVKANSKEDFEQIKHIASSNFNHGRFFEDGKISKKKAQERNIQWIENAIQSNFEILVLKPKLEVLAFLVSNLTHLKTCDVHLGGSKQNSILTPKLIANGLSYYRDRKYKYFNYKISASNISMINISIRLGGKIVNSSYGFHRYYLD